MIADELELGRTRNQLTELETGLSELKRRVYHLNPERFRLMSESYLSEIEMLRGRIDDYLGIREAREAAADFVLKIQSPLLAEGIAPAAVVNSAITGLQRGVQKLGEFLARDSFGVAEGVPSHTLAQEFELEVVAVAAGSFEVGLRMSSAGRIDLPPGSMREVIRRFREAAAHTSEGDATPEILSELVSDLSSQLQVLRALKEIAPPRTRKDVTVQLSSRAADAETVTFRPQTRSYIASLIRTRTRHAEETGDVREVDLDRRTFKIRTRATTLRCRLSGGREDLLARALGRRVRVAGTAELAPDGSIKFFRAEGLDLL